MITVLCSNLEQLRLTRWVVRWHKLGEVKNEYRPTAEKLVFPAIFVKRFKFDKVLTKISSHSFFETRCRVIAGGLYASVKRQTLPFHVISDCSVCSFQERWLPWLGYLRRENVKSKTFAKPSSSSTSFYARQPICYSAYMPRQFRLSVCPSVRHTRVLCHNIWTYHRNSFTVR